MLYPIVIHKDPESTFGVTVPDLPGCFSAGDTLDEALRMSQEAIELHIEGLLEDNDAVPIPHSIDEHQKSTEFQGGIWALVDVDLDKLMGPAERINITVPRFALRKIDAAAAKAGMNRSQFLVRTALSASF
ncbi:MAG: type II toxin-antitoxin system HicB family antitoxin [Pseudohongiella sp.]|nr:type II toxin-antitoxin system HicB family antitoxin [Pseudohongiella sp.]MDP2286371.1 type II toxin-antitoxin system HicB family antitoxin [Pseudohongiella sp.]